MNNDNNSLNGRARTALGALECGGLDFWEERIAGLMDIDVQAPVTHGLLIVVLEKVLGVHACWVEWNAYFGRGFDEKDPDENVCLEIDNSRQWRVKTAGQTEEVYERWGELLDERGVGWGPTRAAALVLALERIVARVG